MSLPLKVVFSLGLAYALILAAAYVAQRRLMYFPDRTRTPPAAIGLASVEELEIPAPDGVHVVAWHGRARPGAPTILYFHGNGGSLAARTPRIERFMAEGWGVFMMTYRGYGGSTGSPTEIDNVADAKRAYDTLIARGTDARAIILYGESLGTGVATQVALDKPAAGLILDAPYTSTVDVAAQRFPFLPVRPFLIDRYDTASRIARVRMPVLVLHGARDGVIPVTMGREIARLASEPKRYVEFPSGGHSDLYLAPNDALTAVRNWVRTLPTPTSRPRR
jgi:hypothetical protein